MSGGAITMTTCEDIEPLLAAWVDGELSPAERDGVEAHLALCGRCRSCAEAGRGARELLHAHRGALRRVTVPPGLGRRLREIAQAEDSASRRRWKRAPLAAAATLGLIFSGATLHIATERSTTLLAAQLAADHVKCHWIEPDHGGVLDPAAVHDRLAGQYGFATDVPASRRDLRLVAARRCLTGEGTNAHLLYRYDGQPLSLYLVPAGRHAPADLAVLGQRAIVWSRHNGTYVLVADADTPDLDRVANYMQAATDDVDQQMDRP